VQFAAPSLLAERNIGGSKIDCLISPKGNKKQKVRIEPIMITEILFSLFLNLSTNSLPNLKVKTKIKISPIKPNKSVSRISKPEGSLSHKKAVFMAIKRINDIIIALFLIRFVSMEHNAHVRFVGH
jgi:hypothetical protein